MRTRTFCMIGAALSAALMIPTVAAAQVASSPQAARIAEAPPVLVQKRQAVQGVSADAMAVLAALQREPDLAKRLAANPQDAQAMLAARGATRAESITVVPGGDGAMRTITITIKIDHVTIIITIEL